MDATKDVVAQNVQTAQNNQSLSFAAMASDLNTALTETKILRQKVELLDDQIRRQQLGKFLVCLPLSLSGN